MSNLVFVGGALRLNPSQTDKVLLSTVLPPGAIIIGVHKRVVFISILINAAQARIDSFQPKIFTAQACLRFSLHLVFPMSKYLKNPVVLSSSDSFPGHGDQLPAQGNHFFAYT